MAKRVHKFSSNFNHKIKINTLGGSFCWGARLRHQAGTGTCYLDTESPHGHQHTAAPPLLWCQKQHGVQILDSSLFLQNWLCILTVRLLQKEGKKRDQFSLQFYQFIFSLLKKYFQKSKTLKFLSALSSLCLPWFTWHLISSCHMFLKSVKWQQMHFTFPI